MAHSHKNSILVKKIPQNVTVEELIKFFSQYDEVVKYQRVRYNQDSIIIKFKNYEVVRDLLSQELYFKGSRLIIYGSNDEDSRSKIISYDKIKIVLNADSTFDSQLAAFLHEIELSDAVIATLYDPICRQLESLFQSTFPKCRAYKFGSSVSGLAFKNSDLDIYFYTGLPVSRGKERTVGPHILSPELLLPVVEKTLKGNRHLFSRCFAIPHASTPIIKFVYHTKNINCDVSFKNKLAIYNSELLKFFFSINPHFRPLMMVIKYWFHNCNLKSFIGINNYALTLLFVFYLQQLKLLPIVIDLKNKCRIPLTISGWQINFSRTINGFEKQINSFGNDPNYKYKDIPQLLQGFFEFYASFDFENYVICPNDGNFHSKELFEGAHKLPSSMMRYREYLENNEDYHAFSNNKPMCVQDPNQLNWNVTNRVSVNSVNKFQIFCAISAIIVENSSKHNYRNLLQDIFSFNSTASIIKQPEQSEDCISFPIYCNNFPFKDQVNSEKPNSTEPDDWFNLLINIIRIYLKKVLGLHIEVCCNKENLNEGILGIQQSSFKMHCIGVYHSWNKQEFIDVTEISDSLLNDINEVQKEPSNKVNEENGLLNFIDIECRLTKKTESKIRILFTVLNNRSEEKIFSKIANNLMMEMPSVIENTINRMYK